MPSYQDILNRHSAAVANGHIDPTTPLEEYARQGAQATGDPSWMDVAEGGPVKNWIRTKNAQLNNAIEAGPVDDWSAAAVGAVGDLFGIDPQLSRDVGRKLPRGAVDFIPMAAGSAVGGAIGLLGGPGGAAAGAALGGDIGLGLTSGLSALNAYGETGKVLDAGIGAIAPTVGSKLSSMGTKAILANAAKPGSYLGRMGFTGGTKVAGQALTAEEQLALAASKQFGTLSAETLAKTTVDKTVVDLARDKFLGYVGGEAAANAGFTGLDILTQGSDAVFNKNYLFANLVSNVPFMAAEIPGAFRNQELNVQYNLPTAEKSYSSAAEQRAHETALMFQGLDSPGVLAKYRAEGLDVADYVKGFQELSVALNERERTKSELGTKFFNDWNTLATQRPELALRDDTKFGLTPEGLIGKDTNVKALLNAFTSTKSNYDAEFTKLALAHKGLLASEDGAFSSRVNQLSKIQDISVKKLQENYQLLSDKVNLGPLMEKPVAARSFDDYKAALDGQLSDKGIDFIRDYHRVLAGEAPESTAWSEYQQMRTDAGKVAYSPDQQFELTVAHALATGKVPDFNVAAKKAKEAQASGETPDVVARTANAALKRQIEKAELQAEAEKKVDAFKSQLDGLPDVIDPADAENHNVQSVHLIRKLHSELASSKGEVAARAFLKKTSSILEKSEFAAAPLSAKLTLLKNMAGKVNKGKKVKATDVEEPTTSLEEAIKQQEDNDAIIAKVSELEEKYAFPWEKTVEELAKGDPGLASAYAKFPLALDKIADVIEGVAAKSKEPEKFDKAAAFKEFVTTPRRFNSKHQKALSELKLAATGEVEIPTPEAPFMQVRAFADAIAGNMEWSDPVSRSRFVEDLPRIARLFNNPEVVYGELGIAPEGPMKMADGFYFRPAVKLNGRVVESPLHLKAWEQHFGKPFSEFGKTETEAMKGSTEKEGYVTPAGFMNRKQALQSFLKHGGKMNLTPGEKRDWLDSSDLTGMKFARIPAGGGFDFGLRPVVGGKIQREGKAPIGNKDGLLTEQELRTHGGVDNVTLTKGEVDFYRQLVPEAFNVGPEKKVNVQKLWDGLGKVGEQVKVVSYGQDGQASEAKQQLDKLTHDWWDALPAHQRVQYTTIVDRLGTKQLSAADLASLQWSPESVAKALQFDDLQQRVTAEPRDTGPRATSYYNQISPFDTKKFPVKRVDVVLPEKQGPIGLTEQNPRLWQQDNLHDNLPNTLGWAMVQIVPHPVTGEKVMFVGELQSLWAQSIRDSVKRIAELRANPSDEAYPGQLKTLERETPLHPLLPIHQNLILKAVIKEAQKQGITKIAISGSKDALMTELLDKPGSFEGPFATAELAQAKANELNKQSDDTGWKVFDHSTPTEQRWFASDKQGGFDVAYDISLPSIMSKLVGEGRVEDFGVHKNSLSNDPNSGVREERALNQAALAEGRMTQEEFNARDTALNESVTKGSPVFRNPDGTPKTNITARVFDISSPSDRVNTLFAKGQGTIFGAASQKAKQIFLNSPAFKSLSTADQVSFIFAHEHAHVAFSKAKSGEYGIEAQALLSRADEWVKTASPEAKANVEDVIRDMAIPKGMSLKDIEGVLKNPNNEEWLANTHAMLAIGALHSANPKEMFAFLPKPIRNFLDWTVATMQRLMKGVTTWAKLGFSLDKYQQVKTMEGYFDAVRNSFREAEFDAAEAAKFLELGNPGMRQGQAEDYLLAQDTTGRPKFMTEPRQFLGTTWQKFVMGMGNLGRMYPVLQPAVDAVRKANDVKMDVNAHIMKIMYGTMSGTGKVLMDSPSLERVVGSPVLKKLWNDLSTNAEKEGLNPLEMREQPDGTVEMVFNDKGMSPELRGRLKQFKPEAQKALLETMANHQRANMALQKFLVEFEKHGATALIANAMFSLPSQKNKAGFEGAYDRAAGLFDGVLNGDQVKIQEAVKGLSEEEATTAVEMAKVYAESNAELKAFYDSRPSYMSLRRFKEFRQRIVDKQGNRDVIDAASTAELNKVLKKYLDAGWALDGIPLRSSDKAAKEAFHVNDAVRDILERKEKRVRDFVELSNIPDDIKADLMKQFNFVGELEHQVNAQSMYKPGTGRNFTGDLSRFDVLEQFMHSVPASISAASNSALNARVNFELRHPELQMQRTQKDQFLALFEQSKKTDGAFWKEMNRANAAFHIGLNFPGHLAEGFQPFLSHIPELRAQGATQWQAMKMIGKAQNEVFRMYGKIAKEKIWKPADVQVKANGKDYDGIPAMWYRANEGKAADAKDIMDMLADNISRVQRAPLADLFEATGREQRKLLDLMEGNRFQTTAEALAAPVHKYEQSVMGLYSNFTQHNGLLALIPAYRQGRANGLTHEAAKLEAARFDLATNNSGGRLERPEMFGKLGDAGHVVYALSSYVRGRFAQLATYYKHGWSEHFKGEEASLTPKQRQDAKAAFKNMILAQVGAAGILGLPFVGAGIALMEEMLDEDLKGKMLKGLEDALGDPVLTRVASHGAAAAFAESAGIPADLHSRFALSSFMGVNSYDGVSAKSFLGPMASMANSLFNMGGSLARGEGPINALAKGGPGGVRRFAEALTDQFRQENPEMNMTASALGFRSADMVKRKEWESIVRNQETEANARKKLAAKEIKKAMKMGPAFARKTMMEQAVKLLPETKNPLERQNALKGIIQGLTSRVQALAADEVAPRDYQGTVSNAVRPQAMEVARAMGMPQNQPMELARALAGQQARGMLGRGFSMPTVRAAAERQQQWDPFNVGY